MNYSHPRTCQNVPAFLWTYTIRAWQYCSKVLMVRLHWRVVFSCLISSMVFYVLQIFECSCLPEMFLFFHTTVWSYLNLQRGPIPLMQSLMFEGIRVNEPTSAVLHPNKHLLWNMNHKLNLFEVARFNRHTVVWFARQFSNSTLKNCISKIPNLQAIF